jgi:hypothetical protein
MGLLLVQWPAVAIFFGPTPLNTGPGPDTVAGKADQGAGRCLFAGVG